MPEDDTVEVVITDRDGEIRRTERVSRERFENEYAHDRYAAARSVDDVKQAYVDGEIGDDEFERRVAAALEHDERDDTTEWELMNEKEQIASTERAAVITASGLIVITGVSIVLAYYPSPLGVPLGMFLAGVAILSAWFHGWF